MLPSLLSRNIQNITGIRNVAYHQVRNYRNIIKLFSERGLLQDVFPRESESNLVNLLQKKSTVGVYAGFDPTADSLHIGNLVVLMGLLHAQRAGLTPIAVIGGATGRIGDPSGKSTERPIMSNEILDKNIEGIQSDLIKIFTNHDKYFWKENTKCLPDATILNNEQFYSDMNIIHFVSNIGRHFRLGTMLGRHSVKTRLETDEGMSLTEFTYQTFQAYDWLRLCKDYNCLIQLGGSDQMGNIVSGKDLISRCLDKDVYGITIPLVVSESGDKFGKSAGTPVWINQQKTSPFQVYQYMMRQNDVDVVRMLKLFTFLPLPEIEAIVNKHDKKPHLRYGQERLAEQVTLLLHGEEGLNLAHKTTDILYKNNISAAANMTINEIRAIFQQADYIQKLYTPGVLVHEFAMSIGCFKTERDALRIISAGGFSINQSKITNSEAVIVPGVHILDNNISVVRVGKKNYYIVEWMMS